MTSKQLNALILFILFLCLSFNSYATVVQKTTRTKIEIKGMQAKKLYLTMTGKLVQEEGAAGHFYRRGQQVLCRYTNADITIAGQRLSRQDPRRYVCNITFDQNGRAYL